MKLLKRFKMKTATPPDLKQYIGKEVSIEGQKVKIETIVGNVFKPAFYEINGDHLVNMLRFHAQMTGAKDITEEMFKAFEEIEYHVERASKETTQDLGHIQGKVPQ
jgi:hypothetical protein